MDSDGPAIRTVAITGSTNEDLLRLARAGAPEGTWLRAERQTGGRGRQGRSWESSAGNLYASTLVRLRPGDPPPPSLALVAAVALHEVTASFAPAVRIKWPNDLLAGTAKLAGILLERAEEAVVIGVGVNLAHHPEGLDRATTSLVALTGVAPEPSTFAELTRDGFGRWLARWRGDGLARIRTAWLAAAHPRGTALTTAAGDGLFDGLTETGSLRLRMPDGRVEIVHAGDVFLI
jgi:BirA family biotin operon repressor/biotin-[acetyl-CoA-carboxylase] ligase